MTPPKGQVMPTLVGVRMLKAPGPEREMSCATNMVKNLCATLCILLYEDLLGVETPIPPSEEMLAKY